jgi:hypothetical protein
MQRSLPLWKRAFTVSVSLASLAVLPWLPAFVSLAVAVAAAAGWCIWLQRHPTA